MKSSKVIFAILIAVVLLTGGLLISKIKLPQVSAAPTFTLSQIIDKIKDSFNYAAQTSTAPANIASPSANPTTSPTPSPKITPNPTLKPTTKPLSNTQPKTCYRYTVPHLDGSSSTKCYTQADYQALQSLTSQYRSAQSDYSFNSSVAEMYLKDGIEFFKESGEKAQAKAQEAKDRMGAIALQMYAVESRGW